MNVNIGTVFMTKEETMCLYHFDALDAGLIVPLSKKGMRKKNRKEH